MHDERFQKLVTYVQTQKTGVSERRVPRSARVVLGFGSTRSKRERALGRVATVVLADATLNAATSTVSVGAVRSGVGARSLAVEKTVRADGSIDNSRSREGVVVAKRCCSPQGPFVRGSFRA